MVDAVIVDAVRTPGGKRNGQLKGWQCGAPPVPGGYTLCAKHVMKPYAPRCVLFSCSVNYCGCYAFFFPPLNTL